jgi:hypothetical protein
MLQIIDGFGISFVSNFASVKNQKGFCQTGFDTCKWLIKLNETGAKEYTRF